MKKYYFIVLYFVLFAFIVSCDEKDDEVKSSVPVIETLTIQGGENITLNDSIYFDATVSDAIRPLSTLEVELVVNDVVLNKKSIRTKGMSVDLKNVSLFMPFNPNIASGDVVQVNFTLINVDGAEAKQQKTLKAQRPDLPDKLYLVTSDKSVIELNVSQSNPYLYESSEGDYASSFNTKIATSQDLSNAEYIWNGTAEDNLAAIGREFGSDVKFAFDNWIVRKITFDAYTFKLGVEGLQLNVKVNDTLLRLSGEYLHAEIAFTQGEEFSIEGLDNVAEAYNRDFFAYDSTTGKFTFLGETGTWSVYYSLTYNYIWVNRMTDTAPTNYWIIGSGFTSIPRWYNDFNDMGWSWDDVKQVVYMRAVGSNKYQADVYLSDKHIWGLDMKMYSSLNPDNYQQAVFDTNLFSGDSAGFRAAGGDSADIVNTSDFVEGYYRITLDISDGIEKAKVDFKKL